MNALDIIVITVVGLSTLIAFFRGLIREIFSLVSWVAASVASLMLYEQAALHLKPYISNPMVAKGAASVGIFVLVMILMAIVTAVFVNAIRSQGSLSFLDRSLGLIFGFLRGALLVSLSYLVLAQMMNKDSYPDWLKQAKTLNAMEMGADTLASLFPQYLDDLEEITKQTQKQAEGLVGKANIVRSYPANLTPENIEVLDKVLTTVPADMLPTAPENGANKQKLSLYYQNAVRAYRQVYGTPDPAADGISESDLQKLQENLSK